MNFLLNAQMNGGFSNTFSKAQQEFARLGNEIQSVNRLQSDISAYQKQQAAIGKTDAKLENLEQQYELLKAEIKATSDSTASLEREKLKLEQRIANANSALENQKQRLEATSARLKEAGVDTDNLAKKEAELAEQVKQLSAEQERVFEDTQNKIKQLSAEQEKAADSARNFADTAVDAFETASSALAAAGIAAALEEISEAYLECVSIAGEFEAGMSDVAALSSATASEMEALGNKAKELGAETKFSAQESAEAMGYMAMAGWNASQMLAGMDGVMSLAAASGEDLATVSDIVTDSMTAFGLTAADTARYADVLAAAATKSNTSVTAMGETFKYAAPIAGALGYSVEDVSVAIGLMANAGIKGSISGTSLRNVFNGLLEGATLTAEAFGDYEYSAIKADGTMRSFSETIEGLRYYFEQMTEAERVANAETIAGKEGYSGLLAILNATDEEYVSLTNSINQCTGAAQRMAAIKMDNLNGDLELMNGSWEALKNTIGEQFIPEMRALYSIGSDVFGAVDEFVQNNPALVKGIAATVGTVGAGVAVLTSAAVAIEVLIPLMGTLTAAIPGVNVIMGGMAALAGVAGAVAALATATRDTIPSVKELTEAARDMQDTMDAAAVTFDGTVSSTMAAAGVADTYISKLDEMGDYAALSDEEQKQYQNTLALLLQIMPSLSECISQTTDEYGRATYTLDASTEALRLNTEAWRKNAMQQAYQEQLAALMATYADVLLEAEKNSIGLTKAQTDLQVAEKKRADALARMEQLWAEAETEAKKMHEEYGTWADATKYLTQEYYDLQSSVADCDDVIWIAKDSIEVYGKALEESSDAVAAAEEEIQSAKEAMESLTGATNENTFSTEEAARQSEELAVMVSNVAEKAAVLADAYTEAYNAALTSISGQYALWDEAANVAETSAGSINSALESQVSYWQEYNSNLTTLTERSADIAGLSDVIASFADGSAESVNAIAGMASASDKDLAAMVENWKNLQAEQQAASASIAEMRIGFNETMDLWQADLAEDIAAMDLGAEAALSGEKTIQGYIDGAVAMLPEIEKAYSRLAAAARGALLPSDPTLVIHDNTGRAAVDIPGYAVGTQSAAPGFAIVGEKGPELVYFGGGERVFTASETSQLIRNEKVAAIERVVSNHSELLYLPQFETGTDNAPPGFAIVGENGPELVCFGGGEQAASVPELAAIQNHQISVLENDYQITTPVPEMLTTINTYTEMPTAKTISEAQPSEATISHSQSVIEALPNIQVVFQIEGNASTETVEALRDYGEEFSNRVKEVVEECAMDLLRRSYV